MKPTNFEKLRRIPGGKPTSKNAPGYAGHLKIIRILLIFEILGLVESAFRTFGSKNR